MKVLIYIEPFPIRNSKDHFIGVARKLIPFLASADAGCDVRMFANKMTFRMLEPEVGDLEARLLRTTWLEERLIESHARPWEPEGMATWLDLMAGKGEVSRIYKTMLHRLRRRFPFDVIVHWGENGAVASFSAEHNIVRLAMELGCTRAPFVNTVVMDPFGTNGSAMVPRLSLEDLREIVGHVPMSRQDALLNHMEAQGVKPDDASPAPGPSEPAFSTLSLPAALEARIGPAGRVAFLPLQLFDDANLLRFSPFGTLIEVVERVVPRLIDAGYTVLVKPHPAARLRAGAEHANAQARVRLQAWGERVIWLGPKESDIGNIALIARSDVVVTVNSSVGFEALYFDKPVVVLGDAIYKPRNLFPTLDEVVEGTFDAPAYREGIGYLRRFFLGGYLLPAGICADAPAFIRHVGMMRRLWQGHGDDPRAVAGALWQDVAPVPWVCA